MGLRTLGYDGAASLFILLFASAVALGTAGSLWGGDYQSLLGVPNRPPSANFLLGTDAMGRDLAARLLQGSVASISIGLGSATLTVVMGTVLGLLAGTGPRIVARLLRALADAVSAVPVIVALLGLALILGAGQGSAIAAIALTQWTSVFRLIRIESGRLARKEFVLAARAMGASPFRIGRIHLLPQLYPLFATSFVLHFAWAVKAEALLGYLGLSSLENPSWGRMLAENSPDLARGIWWTSLAPAACLALLLLSAQLLSDRLASSRLDDAHP